MKNKKIITTLSILIIFFSIIATTAGIFSNNSESSFTYPSIRGETIQIYGKGIYKHMSSEVAIQGIAQDYVTLCLGIPLLLIALLLSRKENKKGHYLFSGIIFYFFLTYLFYTAMAMYNIMFLVYVILLGLSFFTLIISLSNFDFKRIKNDFKKISIIKKSAIFLIINATLITLLWLSIILPPLFNGTIYPKGLEHYTTLIVQGFDLGLFLPIAFVSACLALKKKEIGLLFTTIYTFFLTILMTALSSKILFMAKEGVNVFPVIFIIPTICLITYIFSFKLIKNIKK